MVTFKSDNSFGVIIFLRVLCKDTYGSIYRFNDRVSGICCKTVLCGGGEMNWGTVKTRLAVSC